MGLVCPSSPSLNGWPTSALTYVKIRLLLLPERNVARLRIPVSLAEEDFPQPSFVGLTQQYWCYATECHKWSASLASPTRTPRRPLNVAISVIAHHSLSRHIKESRLSEYEHKHSPEVSNFTFIQHTAAESMAQHSESDMILILGLPRTGTQSMFV